MILVGAPSWQREWIIEDWAKAIDRAARNVQTEIAFILEMDTHDTATHVIMERVAQRLGREYMPLWVEEDEQDRDRRRWGVFRYQHMVTLRNTLLEHVRELKPELFLSLDTDIIVHPQSLEMLLDSIQKYDVVGGKCFMTPSGTWAPSWAVVHNESSLVRYDSDLVMPVEVVMGMKLMTPPAYTVDYELHELGEDIGISRAWQRAGLRIGWDGRICNKHVMVPERLSIIDPRCGY